MPDTDILVSELNSASQINTTDLLLMTQPDGDAQTGYSSRKGTVLQVANKLLKDTEYTTDLPNFDNKSVFGALNEIHNGTYIYKENETPYQLRQTPITANRTLEKLIGVSCAFNQLVQNGNFADSSGWNKNGASTVVSYTNNKAVGTTNDISGGIYRTTSMLYANHKYFYSFKIKNNATMNCGFSVFTSWRQAISPNSELTWYGFIGTLTADSNGVIVFYNAVNANLSFEIANVQLIDLTACFGSEVADYLYNLENS